MSSTLYQIDIMICGMETLAERITHIRESLGLSGAAFGRKIGISRSAVNQIELGGTQALKASTIVAIERISGFNGEWIESGRGPQRKRTGTLPKGTEDQITRIYAELINLPQEYRDKIESDIDFFRSLNKPDK